MTAELRHLVSYVQKLRELVGVMTMVEQAVRELEGTDLIRIFLGAGGKVGQKPVNVSEETLTAIRRMLLDDAEASWRFPELPVDVVDKKTSTPTEKEKGANSRLINSR